MPLCTICMPQSSRAMYPARCSRAKVAGIPLLPSRAWLRVDQRKRKPAQ
jgi:hypothetical protein